MKAKVWRLYGAKDIVMSIAALLAGVVIANEGDGAIPVVAEKAGPIEVRVDPNFELIAMVCHLAGYEEYALSLHKEKDRKLIKDRFGSLTNHPAVKAFKNYRKKAGISYDAPASLSVHLKPDLSGYLVPLDPWPERLDTRWKKIDLEEVRRQLPRRKRRAHPAMWAYRCSHNREPSSFADLQARRERRDRAPRGAYCSLSRK